MNFDAITVGGGLAGSTFAAKLTRAGHQVLVLERETRFKDRVRGENMLPWGVAAARRLGLVDDLLASSNYGRHMGDIWQDLLMAQRDILSKYLQTEPLTNWFAAGFNANISLKTSGNKQTVTMRADSQFRGANITLSR